MKRYGLVFKIDDQCYLAEYSNGTVEDAYPIGDEESIYTDLNPREISLVEISSGGDTEEGEVISLVDLKTITIENEEDPEKCIVDLIQAGAFSEFAESIFENEV